MQINQLWIFFKKISNLRLLSNILEKEKQNNNKNKTKNKQKTKTTKQNNNNNNKKPAKTTRMLISYLEKMLP